MLLLAYYNINRQYILKTNSLDSITTIVFLQLGLDSKQYLVGYFLKTIDLTKYNYTIYNKKLLAIIKAFEYQQAELKGSQDPILVVTNYKALEYFITTKSLIVQQVYQAEILSKYNFQIVYKPGKLNCADLLIRREQDITPQKELKKLNQEQVLLCLEMLSLELQETIQI